MLLWKSPSRHAVYFLLTVFIIQQSGHKMAVGVRQTFCDSLTEQDNGNTLRARQWPKGTRGACSSTMAQLLSKPFILFYSKVKAKLRWEATWQHLGTVQAKIYPGRPFPSCFTVVNSAHHPSEQTLFSGSHMDTGPPIDTDSVTVILTTFLPWKSRHQCFLLQLQELQSLLRGSESTCNRTSKWTLQEWSLHLHLCKWLLIQISLSCV